MRTKLLGAMLGGWAGWILVAVGAGAAGALVSGCKVGPEPGVMRREIPADFGAAKEVLARGDRREAGWWEDFGDPILVGIIEAVSTNNLEYRRALARLKEARAAWVESRWNLAPGGQASAGWEKLQNSVDDTGLRRRQSELYRTGFDATWELDLWGGVRRNVEATRATVESVESGLAETLISVRAEAGVAYVELRGLQAQLAVAARNATNQSQTLGLAVALRDGGEGTQLDVARAGALLNATLATIPPMEFGIRRSIHRISVLCGKAPGELAAILSATGEMPTGPEAVLVGDPGALLRRRPDVRAAERLLAAATARVGVETADLFPRVRFFGGIGLEASQLSGLTAAGGDTHHFGPVLSWAALDLGRVRQRIRAAGARAEQGAAVYERTVLLALEEAENSLVALREERRRVRHLAEAERAAAEAVGLVRQRYRDGFADYLSVLDAERTLLNLQDQLAVSRTVSAQRLIGVYKAFAVGLPEVE